MKVIVIRFSSLGDCILLCPFLDHLKQHGAEEVTVITKRAYVELFSVAVGVDRIAAFDPGGGARGLVSLVNSQRGRGAVVLDAHNNWRSRLVARGLGGAEARIAKYYRQRIELILLKEDHAIPSMSERYASLGTTLGMPPLTLTAGGIHIPAAAQARAQAYLPEPQRAYVALAPGSRWPMKEWGADRFGALAKNIVEKHGLDIVLLGDHGDAATSARVAHAVGKHATDLAGRTSIVESAALIEGAVAFVGNDSGLMHLAEAVGIPVLALFGPTVDTFGYYPSLPASKVVERRLACRPCSRNGARECPYGTHECLERIPLEPVADAFTDLIERRGPNRYILN